jgi:Protein of unknown function (DUF4058)
MPLHDWTRVRANRFHDFHQDWSVQITRTLNAGVLPEGYWAMTEQKIGGPEPDVITLSVPFQPGAGMSGGATLADSPVNVRYTARADATRYAQKANRITIRHPDGDVVAVIEIVSPGNKDSRHAIKSFVRKAVQFLNAGIHLLIVDLFPPSKRDPQGIHKLIWDRLKDEDFTLPADKPLTLAAYSADTIVRAFVEPVAVSDVMPDMPIFLTADRYVPVPLESTYQTSWEVFPKALKPPLENTAAS